MAHNLNFNELTGQYSLMSTKTPWHNLGQVVDSAQTSEEAIKLSGLDFEVVKKKIYTEGNIEIPRNYATVRTDLNIPLGVVGEKYHVLQNSQAFKFIDDMGFVAHKGFVNYVGELNINYYPSFFKILDIFNLSNFINDANGSIQLDVNDRIFEALNFINFRFKNIYHLKLTKSLLIDSHALKPNDEPEIYSPKNILNDSQIKVPPQPQAMEEKPVNINEKIDTISKKELIEKIDNKDLDDDLIISKIPQHPYSAPRYSDFYSPIYDPYNITNSPSNYYLMNTYGVQDPVTEHPH